MPDHIAFSEDMREIVESFVVETQELFDQLNDDLLQLEHAEDRSVLINKIFRAVHTVKGTSGFLNLQQLSVLAHRFEDVLNRLRNRELPFHPDMMDVMFAAFDMMNVLLQQVLDEAIEPIPLEGLLADLALLSAEGGREESSPADDHSGGGHREAHSTDEPKAVHGVIRRSDSVRLETRRLEELQHLVGELALTRNQLAHLIARLHEPDDAHVAIAELAKTSSQLDHTTSELERSVIRMRMVSIGSVFNKFPRLVRNLARELDKKIEMELIGIETELDRSIVEELGEPLLHLIRNAVGHGIEPPATRSREGKPEYGRIVLGARQEGNAVLITVEDDGAGMDPETLRQRAVALRVHSEPAAAELSTRELLDLIFHPGFSTTDDVSYVSGRGVGMDVVKSAVSRMNGTVHVESIPGQGARILLRLPLMLSLIPCLLVTCAGEAYAIPLHGVREIVALGGIETAGGRPIRRIRNEVLPLLEPAKILGQSPARARPRYAAVVEIDGEHVGLILDDVLGQAECVVKPLGKHLRMTDGISGATILKDGRVAMVLDSAVLVRMTADRHPSFAAEEAA